MKAISLIILFCSVSIVACHKDETSLNTLPASTPEEISMALSKGVNLADWFNDFNSTSFFPNRFNATDMQRIKSQGFTHVRIPIGSSVLFTEASPEQLNPNNIGYVSRAIDLAIQAGLTVILDGIHEYTGQVELGLASQPGYADKVSAYWKAIAIRFSKYPTNKIVFEVFNEPHISANGTLPIPKTWWAPVQEKIVQTIRSVTKTHWIIVGAESWNGRTDLLSLPLYTDSYIVYNFHFYDPFLFTHQGATWVSWNPVLVGKDIPYPSSPTLVAPLIANTPNQELKDALQSYGNENFNKQSLTNLIGPVADWAQKNHLVITCNEFGSYRPFSPRASRLQWITDIRSVLEENNIGWAMWDYDGGFGMVDYTNNDRSKPVTDTEVLHALGLFP